MTGSALENKNTDPTDLVGLSNLKLIFEGGSEDMGAAIEGWTDNFTLGTLTLGGADIGQLELVDLFDNQPLWEGSEALYVHNLNIGASSYLETMRELYVMLKAAPQDPAASCSPRPSGRIG